MHTWVLASNAECIETFYRFLKLLIVYFYVLKDLIAASHDEILAIY